jgi:ligand-binding sensor domain-containing protein
MNKYLAIAAIVAALFLTACGGGDGSLDSALNPYGFVISAFDSSNTNLASDDVRSVIRSSASGPMYAATNLGVASFSLADATPVFTPLPGSPTDVNKLVPDGTSGDFFVCADNGLFKYNATTGNFSPETDFAGKRVLDFTRQSDSVYWVGLEDLVTAKSIARVESGVATKFYGPDPSEGNTASSVACIYVDSDMVMAAGTGDTGNGGLFKFDPSGDKFIKQSVTTGLAKGATLFFRLGTNWYAGGPDSGLVVSTDNGNSWNETGLKDCTPVDFSIERYNYIGNQRYWIASEKGAWLSYDMANFQSYTTSKQLAADAAAQIFTGSGVWVAHPGVGGGLSRLAFDGN